MPKVLLLYHFYAPDDVAGALQFSGLGEGLAARGFEVEAWPCNRGCHSRKAYSVKPEVLNGVTVRRVWRPAFPQHRFWGRIANAIWMMKFWGWRALFSQAPDMVILGTDPIFGLFLAPFLKWRWPGAKMAHWVFDLYPEYPIAEGIISQKGIIARGLRLLMKHGYGKCDLTVDLGACMRERLAAYPIRRSATLTPWSLEEPEKPLDFDPEERKALFGGQKLGLLYSGNLSHPHEFYLILKLARKMRNFTEPIKGTSASIGAPVRHTQGSSLTLRDSGQGAVFTYSARGSRLDDLQKALNPEDVNVRFALFAPLDKLAVRLSAPDVHLVSLKETYTGVAVPSKFFGALAAGRPVLFEGDPRSAIARWIEEYGVGWVLKAENLDDVAEALETLSGDARKKKALFKHCHQVYREHFSRQAVVDRWARELRGLSA